MKLINPILITLNNTLHIKADNLEPVEVDSSCVDNLLIYAKQKWLKLSTGFVHFENNIKQGINISELSDRIEVREVETKCGHCNKLYRCTNCDESCGREGHFVYTDKAFLLPKKEDKFEVDRFTIIKMYTIEEIEKAIDGMNIIGDRGYFKEQIINNLKK